MFQTFSILENSNKISSLVENIFSFDNESQNLVLSESLNSSRFTALNNNKSNKFFFENKVKDNFQDEDEDIDDNEIYLCLLYQSDKLGCSYYDSNKKCLYLMTDIQENSKFEITNFLIKDLNPNYVITSSKADSKFVSYLKHKSKYDFSVEKNLKDEENNNENLEKRNVSFVLLPNNDFNYNISKERILGLNSLEEMPKNMNESEKIVYFSGFFDFNSKLLIKSVGGLLKYLDRNRVNFELESNLLKTPINSIRSLNLSKLLILDSNSLRSLQIFNDVDLFFSDKQSYSDTNYFRTTLNDKFNNTLYSLFLSKIQTKNGISKLRSYLMKPTRDTVILDQRHEIISFFFNFQNQELTQSIRQVLKNCKYINPIFKRMRITKTNLNEWKRLYKTTQAFVKMCEFSRLISHTKNVDLITSIVSKKFEAKFDFLINLFEKTIDIKESTEIKKCKIKDNISQLLDEKRILYSQLPELLTEVARSETKEYNLNGCKITYLQNLGYLLILKTDEIINIKNTDFSKSTNLTESMDINENDNSESFYQQENFNILIKDMEERNNFKFFFKIDNNFYYKTNKCLQLDKNLGDIAIEINDLENEILDSLQLNFLKYSHIYADMIDFCAELDCLLAFSAIAQEYSYIRPNLCFEKGSFISAKKVRHPLVELNFDNINSFIPNDVETGIFEIQESTPLKKIKVVTGPNASGKTIYLKQIALLVYMTMIGSYVPANEAQIGDFDRIFTRLNSNECISLQMSAFSIDLKQISDSISGSSSKSLILIDEFGQSTKLFDGQALVASILRYWINQKSSENMPHVYLSTHFLEIFQNEILFNNNIDKMEFLTFDYLSENENENDHYDSSNQNLIFFYSLKKGISKSSFSLNIAEGSKLPKMITQKATNLLAEINSYLNTNLKENLTINQVNKENEIKTFISQNELAIENLIRSKATVQEALKINFDLKNADNMKMSKEAESKKWRDFLKKIIE